MGKEESDWKVHVLVLPFPAQGHINPLLQLSKCLTSKGIKVTLITTRLIANSMHAKAGPVRIETISDGYDQGGKDTEETSTYLEHFEANGSRTLAELIEKQNDTKFPIKCLIYDSVIPWALNIAKRFGLIGAVFFTQACVVNAIYYHVHHGLAQGPIISMPGLPSLETHELPSYVSNMGSYPTILKFLSNQFSNVDKANWILFNTFHELEEEVITWMAKQWPMKTLTIGPTVPSICQDYQVQGDKAYGLNLFKPELDACMKWLETKQAGSVIYVSFGSITLLGAEQMEELECGLKKSNNYYLWVTKGSKENNFAEETLEKGLVVTWCPQLDVLAHQAIGCFITHCGWNSTIEALSLGVPMVAMPQFSDQTTNAKFVEDVWRVGIRAKADEKGIVRSNEIQNCVREVMNGEKGVEIKKNSEKWKDLAKEAVIEGGSSNKNIKEFVAKLVCTSP